MGNKFCYPIQKSTFYAPMQHGWELTFPFAVRFYFPDWLWAVLLLNGARLRDCLYLSPEGVLILELGILNLSVTNHSFLRPWKAC